MQSLLYRRNGESQLVQLLTATEQLLHFALQAVHLLSITISSLFNHLDSHVFKSVNTLFVDHEVQVVVVNSHVRQDGFQGSQFDSTWIVS